MNNNIYILLLLSASLSLEKNDCRICSLHSLLGCWLEVKVDKHLDLEQTLADASLSS